MEISRETFNKEYHEHTLQWMSDKYGVSKVTINAIRKKLGIKGKGHAKKLRVV